VLLNDILVAVPLQIIEVGGVAVICGIGFTLTLAVIVAVHPFTVPVIVYAAVPTVLLLLFVSTCDIGVPLPADPPLIPTVSATVQA
jgi:hypothetical protein